MWQPTGFGDTIFRERYAIEENETWPEACRRVAESVGKNETKEIKEKFYQILVDRLFQPGGRIFYGAGRAKQGLLNCFVVPAEDSMRGWGKTVSNIMEITAMGGGVGINFSPVRGRGEPISRGGVSTGSVSLMDMCDRVGDVLRGGGGRRIAMMHTLNIDHPDIEEFITAKKDLNRLNNANVSVMIPQGFDYEDLRHSPLFDTIVEGALGNGEPGILNGKLANEMNPMSHLYPLISTNPCGEIWLPAYGVCCLGALVLPRFYMNGRINIDLLKETTQTAVRFLDDVIDENYYALPETEKMSKYERRLGLGVMGLHSLLMDMGMKYGSDSSYSMVDDIFRHIKNYAYAESINLASEKGAFDGWTEEAAPRIQTSWRNLPRRNVALLTVAPTGTTAIVHGVSSGIEPMFAPAFLRRHWRGDDLIETLVVTNDYVKHGVLAQGAYDISIENHFKMQSVVQKHVDNAVSKTINLPRDTSVEEIKDIWFKYIPVLKGTTLYRSGSRDNEPMTPVKIQDIPELLKTWKGEIEIQEQETDDKCESGVCAL